MDSNYQGVEEVVPRKLYKAWSHDDQAMVALKLVEVYGFEAASAWADQHSAVPSSLVRVWLAIKEMLGRAHASILQHSDDWQVSEAQSMAIYVCVTWPQSTLKVRSHR
ncbi:hypothetical protein WJX82_006356 [Trebouxia sp. C0006]